MDKTYLLKGLDCANCAAKIEVAVMELDCVASASVSFISGALRVDVRDGHLSHVKEKIQELVHRFEPDVAVVEQGGIELDEEHSHSHEHGGKKALIKLIAGAAVFAAGMLITVLFTFDWYISLTVFILGYLILGGEIVFRALKNIAHGRVFDESFLMSLATIGAFIIGEYPEAVAVMLFYQVGEYFQALAVRRSKKSITDLMDIRPDFANVKRNGETLRVSPDTVDIVETILVRPGEKIPIDGVVVEGEAMLDTMALTGESIPRPAKPGDTVLSGCINQNGVLSVEVTTTFGESTAAKIIDLVENAGSKKAPTENFITKFSRYYTPVVVLLAAVIAIAPPLLFGGMWADWLNRGLIFLVISCPCALVVSIPLGFFGGVGCASKRGVLVKGGNYLEALNNLDIVVFDKTGTLTKGVFKVTSVQPSDGFSEDELLALAAKAEAFSNHPIAQSILYAFDGEVEKNSLTDYNEISGYGISVRDDGRVILAGNHKLMDREDVDFTESSDIGTKIYIAVDKTFAGCIVISDEIKADSAKAIAALKSRGVRKTIMLTGDDPQIAEAIANKLQLDGVYGGLHPGQKVEKVEMLDAQKRPKGKLAFVGDGINDAPVLARADIGVAMGGFGSDAAIEAADVVLMTDEPSKLAEAVDIARYTRRIVRQNIIFALGAKGFFLILGALGAATVWGAVFADVGVSLLAVLNATRILRTQGNIVKQ